MGQFDKHVLRTLQPPPLLLRIFQVMAPVVAVIRAVAVPSLESILWAVFFVALMLPAGIAPKAVNARLTGWEQDRPVLSDVLGFLLMGCATFLLLRWFLDRVPSAVIAIVLGSAFLLLSHRRRRARAVR